MSGILFFIFASCHPLNRKSGGSALYIHDSISFKIRNDLILTAQNTNSVPHSESVFLEIVNSSNSKNIVVGNVYRAHRTDINVFNSDLSRYDFCGKQISFIAVIIIWMF